MSKSSTAPNVIFVLTDDQGYGDLSCHGNPVLRTPCLDQLHSESVRLTDFHCAPMCTPTRGELMTGLDAMRNGATFVCMGRSLMRADLPTVADIFAANGYHTGHFGKWHLGDNYPYRPQDRGFHETIWHPGFGITSAPDYFGNDYMDDHLRHKDEIEQYKGYCTDVWFREAMKWMDGCVKDGTPFFTYIATNAPHGPLWVPDEYRRPYISDVQRNEASFFGMIANIDENMGRLDRWLKESGLDENTILIFMTDNGTATGENVYNAGMRGKKCSLYDGGHRVPFFVRWPQGGIGGGRDVGDMTRSTDVLPTLVDLCGLAVEDGVAFDGLSLADALQGTGPAPTGRMSVIQYGHLNENNWCCQTSESAAVLLDQWRLVNHGELYNIAADPGQQADLAGEHPEVLRRLQDCQDRWWDELSGTFTTYQPIVIGSPQENPMRLCGPDWAWAYADNQQNVRGCAMESGTWHVEAARAGQYEFTLRRWPEESGLGIAEGAPVMQGFDGSWPEGVALPVASAWISAGGVEASQPVPDGAASVSFRMALDSGPAQIKTWWFDDAGAELAGAYYMTATRLG